MKSSTLRLPSPREISPTPANQNHKPRRKFHVIRGDADSNRRSTTVLGVTTTYSYAGPDNRLTKLGATTSYSYDASGNLTGDGSNTWTYDARGRMVGLLQGTTTASFGINGFGQRITKSGTDVPSGGTNEFLYDDRGNLLGEYGSTGATIEETMYLPDTPVSVLSKGLGTAGFGPSVPVAVITGGGALESVTPDWLGLPHIIANGSKQYLWTWDHLAFYDNAPNQNPAGLGTFTYNPRGFQYKDIESNTNYNGQLDLYNPATGIRGQFDPLHYLNPGRSGYTYDNQNPLTNVDPTGQQAVIAVPCLLDPYCAAFVGGTIVLTSPAGQNFFSQIGNKIKQWCTTNHDDECAAEQRQLNIDRQDLLAHKPIVGGNVFPGPWDEQQQIVNGWNAAVASFNSRVGLHNQNCPPQYRVEPLDAIAFSTPRTPPPS